MKVGIVSGGFDPVHVGHIRMIQAAKRESELLIVILNSDDWLTRKKGSPFMPFNERAEVLLALRDVDYVIHAQDADDTVVASLEWVRNARPDDVLTFFNGGDRTGDENTPESDFCRANGIYLRYGAGGRKIQSSSALVANARRSK